MHTAYRRYINVKFRCAFVSSINSPLQAFASYLHELIINSVPKARSYIENSFQLVDKLRDQFLNTQFSLISLDVISLFNNVPSDLIIRRLGKRWHFINKNMDIPYSEFIRGIRLVIDLLF